MKYNLVVKERAKADIEAIALYYNNLQEDLGLKFWYSVEIAFKEITTNPLGYQVKYSSFRTKLTKPFPYLLIYEVIENNIIVYQCFGGSDNPIKKYKHK